MAVFDDTSTDRKLTLYDKGVDAPPSAVGYADAMRVRKGDILVFAPNEEHGAYVGPDGAKVLDVFSPPREDLLEKLNKSAG